MNPDLGSLKPYPFQRIAQLYGESIPVDKPMISFAMGEPKHPTPAIIVDALRDNLSGLSHYPLTKGADELRVAIAQWLNKRFNLSDQGINPTTQILPVNGTREALFAFAQAVVDRSKQKAKVLMPNPFYQIYEGAALLAGAEPVYLPCTAGNHFLPDFDAVDDKTWEDCQLIYLCSPGNPTGAVIPAAQIIKLLERAEKHDFIIASDECYSEIYFDEDRPPVGLLEVAAKIGNTDFTRCVVFHSLSKRSNAPGLRSGFVAGDASLLEQFLLYRTYHGCAMSPPTQAASIVAWQDETHVIDNRRQYRDKFDAVLALLSPVIQVEKPDAGFYLWADVGMDDEVFTKTIFEEENLRVVPGSYLSRDINQHNPGKNRIRMALVANLEECLEGAERIQSFMQRQS